MFSTLGDYFAIDVDLVECYELAISYFAVNVDFIVM